MALVINCGKLINHYLALRKAALVKEEIWDFALLFRKIEFLGSTFGFVGILDSSTKARIISKIIDEFACLGPTDVSENSAICALKFDTFLDELSFVANGPVNAVRLNRD
jgi:hypothetical protein